MKSVAFLPLVALANAAAVYPMVNEIDETCETQGYAKFESSEECFAAAEAMGLQPKFETHNVPRPLGCYRRNSRVYFGLAPNTGGAQAERIPLCKTDEQDFPWIYENGATCESSGYSLLSEDECWDAGEAQGLIQGWTTTNPNRPEGCYRKGYKVFYGAPSVNAGNGAQQANGRHPICGPANAEPAPAPVPEDESVTAVPEFEYADNGICSNGVVFATDDSSTISKKDQCAIECKAQGFEFFASTDAGQPSCRCCEEVNPDSGAGGWFQYKFAPTTTIEAVFQQGGVCTGSPVYTDESLGTSNKEQCMAECLLQEKPYFANCEECGQPACRCCDELKTSYAGGWLQYSIEAVVSLPAPGVRRIEDEHADDSEEDVEDLDDE